MQEVLIDENEHGQRLDRFVSKFLDEAPRGFIYRMIRRKNIEVNRKRAKPETMLKKGDKVQFFLADETIAKFQSETVINKSNIDLDLVYEDDNILLINKKRGVLSHSSGGDEENIVDGMLNYLIENNEYDPKEEVTFTPSICNRLDRNTSGIIIGAKNYQALKEINEGIRKRDIRRLYKTIVKGEVKKDLELKDYLIKDKGQNMVEVISNDKDNAKKIETHIRVLDVKNGYSLLEVELITGRTHQIRGHLESLGYPIIGDRKYGDSQTNKEFYNKYKLDYQWLHGYKVEFNNMDQPLAYLNGKSFESKGENKLKEIEKSLFN